MDIVLIVRYKKSMKNVTTETISINIIAHPTTDASLWHKRKNEPSYSVINYCSKYFICVLLPCVFVICSSCTNDPDTEQLPPTQWTTIKSNAQLEVHVDGFAEPYIQPLATMGWEDGISISEDGLDLYCTYVPGDFLSFVIGQDLPYDFEAYLRGPKFEMDLVTNPVGANSWIHADILYAHRNSLNESFDQWTLSNMARHTYSEGAPQPVASESLVFFTSNDTADNNVDIRILSDSGFPNPAGIGGSPTNFPNTQYAEDNPCGVRIDAARIIVFFDSEDNPSNQGSHDLWYTIGTDDGTSWSPIVNVSTINTADKEHQPFLFYDSSLSKWYLYYAANFNGKLSIYRAMQQATDDWDSWGAPELIISAGNTAGIGEPSVTSNGDISFVVVYENPNGSDYNKYDADPWFLPRK